jgi:hypothetical protein
MLDTVTTRSGKGRTHGPTAPSEGLPYPPVVSALASDVQHRSSNIVQGPTTTTTRTEETAQLHIEVNDADESEVEENTELLRQMDNREMEKLERIPQVISKLKGIDGSIRIHGDSPLLDNPSYWAESEKWIANWKIYKLEKNSDDVQCDPISEKQQRHGMKRS